MTTAMIEAARKQRQAEYAARPHSHSAALLYDASDHLFRVHTIEEIDSRLHPKLIDGCWRFAFCPRCGASLAEFWREHDVRWKKV